MGNFETDPSPLSQEFVCCLDCCANTLIKVIIASEVDRVYIERPSRGRDRESDVAEGATPIGRVGANLGNERIEHQCHERVI